MVLLFEHFFQFKFSVQTNVVNGSHLDAKTLRWRLEAQLAAMTDEQFLQHVGAPIDTAEFHL